jgi:hypothetical protein
MSPFEAVRRADLFIIDSVFQRLVDYAVDHGGPSCFGLARACYTATLGSFFALDFIDGRYMVVAGAFDTFIIWLNIWGAINSEKNIRRNCLNPERLQWGWRAMLLTLVFVFNLPDFLRGNVFDIAAQASFLCGVYFCACTPRPPKPKTVSVRNALPEGAS